MKNNSITKDKTGREWLHPTPPIYYLHQYKRHFLTTKAEEATIIGKWAVINVETDFCVTKLHTRRSDAVKEFMRAHAA